MKNILTRLIESLKPRPAVDPAVFNDEVALRTQWTPLKPGGASFGTHRLMQDPMHPERIEFRASFGARFFSGVFMLMGAGVVGIFAIALTRGNAPTPWYVFIPPLAVGSVFFLMGGYMLKTGTRPIMFDKKSGKFWIGAGNPEHEIYYAKARVSSVIELSHIHALQIVREYCRGNRSSYYSYELNLVLKNAQRVNVIDHGNLSRLQEDAVVLSGFLGVPVWSAV